MFQKGFPGSCTGAFTKSAPTKVIEKLDGVAPFCEFMGRAGKMLCGEMNSYIKPLAWTTFLAKDYEVVLTFQGTKLSEFAMFEFTMKQDPIFFEYLNYHVPNARPNGAVMTEGLAMYIYQLLNCIDSIFYNIQRSGFKNVDYITGHSLGGSAATVYAQLQTPYGRIGNVATRQSAFLVTFGAPATFNRECLKGQCP